MRSRIEGIWLSVLNETLMNFSAGERLKETNVMDCRVFSPVVNTCS